MGKEIYVFDSALNIRISLTTDGSLDELSIESKNAYSLVEGVYLGKVIKVVPGIDAAFIDCGLAQDAFLNLEGVKGGTDLDKQLVDMKPLTEGSKMLIQVKSDARDGKGPRVSSEISLVGKYTVFRPVAGAVTISRRIIDKNERARLNMIFSENKKVDESFIIRTAARGQNNETILYEIARLRKAWIDIGNLKGLTESVGLVWPAPNVTERFFRDYLPPEVESVIVSDNSTMLEEVKGYCKTYCPEAVGLVEAPAHQRAKIVEENLEDQLEEVGASNVRLPSGGRLYFDEPRSMTTVDVDTGEHSAKGGRSSVAFQTNLEAASVLGRQIRLRNIGGLIVIDFVGMKHGKDRQRVLKALRISLNEDIAPVRISGFSEFGVVELTRYRRGFSYSKVMKEICQNCEGEGQVKNIRAVIDDLFVALSREIFSTKKTKFSVVSNGRTINFIREYCLEKFGEVEKSRAVKIDLMVDPDIKGVEFRIVSG